uniref:Cytochrome P450 CYP4416C1 n=1 Tax=Chrysoperla zastrowi sillemi TaxID=482137 RepID=A0A9E7YCG0_9NEOP|nr:cytochrome P450 CYP4416C1 [Chrysoperla zastrowi sillemi]
MFLKLFLNCFQNNSQIGLVLLVLVIVLIYMYNTNYLRIVYYLSKIPGPKSYPIIGVAYLVIGKTHAEITQLVIDLINKFSPILKAYLGPIPLVCVSSPEYVREILTNHHGLEKPWLMTHIAVDVAGDSILSAQVPKWKHNRSKIVRGFTPNILKTYFKVMIESSLLLSKKLEDKLNDSKSFDILEYLSKAAMDSVARSTMGVNVNVQDSGSTFYGAMQSMFHIAFDRIYSPWKLLDVIFRLSQDFQRFSQDKKAVIELAEKIISEKRYQKTCINNNDNKSDNIETIDKELSEKSLLDILLEVTKNDPLFDDQQLKDEVIFMIIAGFETTANALGYVLLNLAVHQDIQNKVCEELFQVVDDFDRKIHLDDLPQLKYMEMVIKESMRLHPTIPLIARKLTRDIKFDEYLVPDGTTVVIPIICLHRNENIWTDPLKFDPERFTPENSKNRHPYAFLPFSAGPRNCVGIRYAWMFMKVVLATLLSRYEFHTDVDVNKLEHEFALSLKLLGGHQVRITPRRRN